MISRNRAEEFPEAMEIRLGRGAVSATADDESVLRVEYGACLLVNLLVDDEKLCEPYPTFRYFAAFVIPDVFWRRATYSDLLRYNQEQGINLGAQFVWE